MEFKIKLSEENAKHFYNFLNFANESSLEKCIVEIMNTHWVGEKPKPMNNIVLSDVMWDIFNQIDKQMVKR